MNEKVAMDDILGSTNSVITMLEYTIEQANNKNFRDTIVTSRNKFENIVWQIYTISKEKGFYVPAAPAGKADIEQVKNSICK